MKQFKSFQITVDSELNVIKYADVFAEFLGIEGIQNLDQVIPPQDLMQLKNSLFAIDQGGRGLSCFRIRTAKGTLNWIASNSKKDDDKKDIIEMSLSDIQTLEADQSTAHLDNMTGLFNKEAIINYAQELVEAYPRKNFYFFLMDIDHFKSVNDTFGHMKGDEVIIDVAHIVRDCVGDYGVVGRIGGDEFMIVFEKIHTEPELRLILRDIRDTVKKKYENFGNCMSITVSLGGALYPDYVHDYDSLFRLADKMLYIAKIKGRDRYIIYTPSVHGDVDEDIEVATVSRHSAQQIEKAKLVLTLMEHFLVREATKEGSVVYGATLPEVLKRIVRTFDLDELYIIDEKDGKSTVGLARGQGEKEGKLEEAQKELPIIFSQELQSLFNVNQMAIANVFDLEKNKYPELLSFLNENKCRVMAVYHMSSCQQGGYIVYLNHSESACRLSETDLSDLLFFGHMLELHIMIEE